MLVRTVMEGDVESMLVRGVVGRELERRAAIVTMISGHEPGHELTPTDSWDTQNSATDTH